jgi:transmembrane sensor
MKKEYLAYDIEDLLDNQEFINWVSNLSESEIYQHFDKNSDEAGKILTAKSILTTTKAQIAHNINQEEIWKKISAETKSTSETGRIIKLSRTIAGLAAVLIAGWLVFTQVIDKTISVHSKFGEIKQQTLPDGSMVSLNANSTIDYNKDFKSNREIRLTGEAFFEVQKGSRFTVVTIAGNVEVLGTSFNVNARNSNLSVYCRTGKVLVYNKSLNKETVLLPGQSVTLENSEWTESNTAQSITWQTGNQHYDKISVKKATKILESFYGVHFIVDDRSDTLVYSGQISFGDINKSIEEITWPFRLKFQIKKDTVYIKSN